MEECVFEVPIYRCSSKQFLEQMDQDVEQHLKWLEAASGGITRDQAPRTFGLSEEHFRKSYGGPWEYNQVVGWLRICARHGVIWGEAWFVDAKRIRRKMSKKHFVKLGTLFEIRDCSEESSEVVFGRILAEIDSVQRQKAFRRRHFELRPLKRIGPAVNWRRVLGEEVGMPHNTRCT